MTTIIESIRGEYLRYKALAEAAMAQLSDEELSAPGPGGGNSIAVICAHLSGNFRSRFTDFLTTDGEKPWRNREAEFRERTVSREELLHDWTGGWDVLLGALAGVTDGQLQQDVTIRRQPLPVVEALHRSLAHLSYHVGQIVYLAKSIRGVQWKYLSIPPGQSDTYNATAQNERAAAHAATLQSTTPATR